MGRGVLGWISLNMSHPVQWCPMSGGKGGSGILCNEVPCQDRALYSEVQCIMGNGYMGPSPYPRTGRHECKHYLPATSLACGKDVIAHRILKPRALPFFNFRWYLPPMGFKTIQDQGTAVSYRLLDLLNILAVREGSYRVIFSYVNTFNPFPGNICWCETRTCFHQIITVPNSSCGKVMFSQVSVCLSMGRRCTPARADTPPPGQTPPYQTATAADGTHPTGMHSCWWTSDSLVRV